MKLAHTFILILLLVMTSCKEETKSTNYENESLNVTTTVYPEDINAVFQAHGGIDTWNTMKGLYFEIEKEGQNEKYHLDLKSRKSVNYYEKHVLGYDGEQVWIKNLDTTKFKSNPKFYYNLMSYFYAMPFIVGDDGINYSEGPSLEFEGKEYPGILISYEAGVGESPEDEYIVYYDPETKKMEWLAYTVTFFSKEKEQNFRLIRYSNWEETNGLVLPTTLQWHVFEDGEVGEVRNEMNFVKAKIDTQKPDSKLFTMPDGAIVSE